MLFQLFQCFSYCFSVLVAVSLFQTTGITDKGGCGSRHHPPFCHKWKWWRNKGILIISVCTFPVILLEPTEQSSGNKTKTLIISVCTFHVILYKTKLWTVAAMKRTLWSSRCVHSMSSCASKTKLWMAVAMKHSDHRSVHIPYYRVPMKQAFWSLQCGYLMSSCASRAKQWLVWSGCVEDYQTTYAGCQTVCINYQTACADHEMKGVTQWDSICTDMDNGKKKSPIGRK